MKICQISKADAFGGGASRVAEELTTLLRSHGHQARHLASWSGKPFDDVRRPLYGKHDGTIREYHLRQKKVGIPELIPFELPGLLTSQDILDYDLLHFHDLSSAISPLTLIGLAQLRPVLWTIHDCSPFTGGCLYPMECTRFRENCGKCPQIGTWPIDTKIDLTPMLRWVKARVHQSGVRCVTPSSWMSELAFSSGMFRTAPEVVSNGVDTDLYWAHPKAEIRRELGLPEDRRIIMISAGHLSDARKGAVYAARAVQSIRDQNPFLILLGANDDQFRRAVDGIDCHSPGYIGDPAVLAKYYSAADLMLFCSLADNQPLTLLESLASGTPVVGFAVGGIPGIIPQDECGFLVPEKHETALAVALRYAFEGDRLSRWSQNARSRAVSTYSHQQFYENHVDLYRRILDGVTAPMKSASVA